MRPCRSVCSDPCSRSLHVGRLDAAKPRPRFKSMRCFIATFPAKSKAVAGSSRRRGVMAGLGLEFHGALLNHSIDISRGVPGSGSISTSAHWKTWSGHVVVMILPILPTSRGQRPLQRLRPEGVLLRCRHIFCNEHAQQWLGLQTWTEHEIGCQVSLTDLLEYRDTKEDSQTSCSA